MKAKRFPRLFFVFTALLVTVCRCSFDRGDPVLISFEDGASMRCTKYIDYQPNWSALWNNSSNFDCDLPCPDGSKVSVKELSSPELMQAVADDGKVTTAVLQSLQKEYCTPESLSKATATVTAAPTQTSTPVVLPPILTGEVTACDVPARFINLRLAQPIFDFSTAIVTININGVSSECVIPSDNPTVLSCTLPQPITFPINIAILINGSPASSFSFEGSYCGYRDPNAPQPPAPENNPNPLPPNPNDPNNPNNPNP